MGREIDEMDRNDGQNFLQVQFSSISGSKQNYSIILAESKRTAMDMRFQTIAMAINFIYLLLL